MSIQVIHLAGTETWILCSELGELCEGQAGRQRVMLPAPIGNGLPRIWIMATSLDSIFQGLGLLNTTVQSLIRLIGDFHDDTNDYAQTLFNPRPLLLLQNLFKIVPKISELFTTSRQTSLQKLLSFTAGRRILEALSYLSREDARGSKVKGGHVQEDESKETISHRSTSFCVIMRLTCTDREPIRPFAATSNSARAGAYPGIELFEKENATANRDQVPYLYSKRSGASPVGLESLKQCLEAKFHRGQRQGGKEADVRDDGKTQCLFHLVSTFEKESAIYFVPANGFGESYKLFQCQDMNSRCSFAWVYNQHEMKQIRQLLQYIHLLQLILQNRDLLQQLMKNHQSELLPC
ncbi:predicted protein [Histoplasma capsulatum var. duboisii H88]|uniref:Predicted protein n=1 Tax=Ajellomyces capsulatus (strain H88) TaxID=544711 RepID=F0UQX3_AJEC8|nr:predicted protein [Histoplasma capsulatum var. duboisii H88]